MESFETGKGRERTEEELALRSERERKREENAEEIDLNGAFEEEEE